MGAADSDWAYLSGVGGALCNWQSKNKLVSLRQALKPS
jgi:hypothetical protein